MFERIGITMRIDVAPTGEERDALARDWADCLWKHLPEAAWLPIPNLGAEAEKFLLQWGIDAVILSGGNDLGACPARDETERVVCEAARRFELPVLGVCRGLHLLQVLHGGQVENVPESHAVSRVHSVRARNRRARRLFGDRIAEVNSFHRQGVSIDNLSPFFEPWSVSEDGFVEMMVHRRERRMAVQWHPERPLPDGDLARRLFRLFYREL